MMEASIGVNLRVTAHSNQGGRRYMEDMFCVAYQPTTDERDLLYAYFGIFDGHGGRDAALYAKTHLMDEIVSQKNFWAEDDASVLRAIRDGFINTHYAMWKELEAWPKTQSGLPSTSGTTASVAFVRRGKLYIGHVGDSAIVLGYQDPSTGYWRARPLTKDHKPENAAENARITQCGGKVISKSGVPRVVWNRPRIGHKGPVRRSTPIDEIPFLAVARSLGDLWSYNSTQNEFVVSPVPDVSVIDIDVSRHRCLILGSDGLWNMLSCQDAVNGVYFAEKNNERQLLAAPPDVSSSQVKNWINPSKRLVDRALDKWCQHNLRADNTSVVTVVIDPPGPPKAQVLRQNQRSQMFQHTSTPSVDSTSVRQQSGSSSSSSLTNPQTYRTARPIPASPHIPHNFHTNYHRPPRQHNTTIGDKRLPKPVTVDGEPHPATPRKMHPSASQMQRNVEQSNNSAKSRVLLKRKSEIISKRPQKLPSIMKLPSVAVMRYVAPHASSLPSTSTSNGHATPTSPNTPNHDVQIHEISSSSESKSDESSLGTSSRHTTSNKKSSKDGGKLPPLELERPNRRFTKHTNRSASTAPNTKRTKLHLKPVVVKKRITVASRRLSNHLKRYSIRETTGKSSAVAARARSGRRSGTSVPPLVTATVPVVVPERYSSRRSLRSESKNDARVTRSSVKK